MMVMMMVPRRYMLQWQGTSQSFSHGVSFCILVLVEKLGWYPPFFHRKNFLLSCKKDSSVCCCCCCCLCFPNSSSSWFWVWRKKPMHWNEFNNSKTYSKLFVSALGCILIHQCRSLPTVKTLPAQASVSCSAASQGTENLIVCPCYDDSHSTPPNAGTIFWNPCQPQ